MIADAVARIRGDLAMLDVLHRAVSDRQELPSAPIGIELDDVTPGMEFDVVVIVDPERIRAHNPADPYVSLTRATQRLGLLHVVR